MLIVLLFKKNEFKNKSNFIYFYLNSFAFKFYRKKKNYHKKEERHLIVCIFVVSFFKGD